MSDPQPWWEAVNWLDVFLTSGLLGTLLTLFMKWRYDRKKMPLERAQIESGIANDNISSTVAINAEYRQLLEVHKASNKADIERTRERHQEEMEALRTQHAQEMASLRAHQEGALELLRTRLDTLENSNHQLTSKVRRLEQDDRASREELARQHRRIGNLETKLTSARDTVLQLVTYIKEHPTGTGEIPTVDYTIFDI